MANATQMRFAAAALMVVTLLVSLVRISEANVFQTVTRTVVNLGLASSVFRPNLLQGSIDGPDELVSISQSAEKHDRARKSAKIGPTNQTAGSSMDIMSIGNALFIVKTTGGYVMGRKETEGFRIPVKAFRGIPYASAPVGDLRFQVPKEVLPWPGIKMATEYRSGCLTYAFGFAVGDEDCLYLNVFVPEVSAKEDLNEGTTEGLPVAVWIPGGTTPFGLQFIPLIYQPRTFTDQGIAFVTLSYRMGVLGFLSNKDAVLPGNYGMHDIVMALKWVQNNIKNFGGDPKQVNLIGHGAGAKAVHALMLSPLSQGFFNTAVLMSGSNSMMHPMASFRGNKTSAKVVAKFLDCPYSGETADIMLNCLRKRGAKELAKAAVAFEDSLDGEAGLGIVMDPFAPDPFMPDHPLNIIQNMRNIPPVPLMVGSVGKELICQPLALLSNMDFFQKLTADWDNQCNRFLPSRYDEKAASSIDLRAYEERGLCRKVREAFFERGEIEASTADQTFIHLYTEMATLVPTYATAMLHSKFTTAPVFYYSFEHLNEARMRMADMLRFLQSNKLLPHVANFTSDRIVQFRNEPAHLDDIFLLLDPAGSAHYRSNQLSLADEIVKQTMTSALATFWKSKGSLPRVPGLPKWAQFLPNVQSYLEVASRGPKMATSRLVSPEKLRVFSEWHDFHLRAESTSTMPSSSTMLIQTKSQTSSSTIPSLKSMLFDDDVERSSRNIKVSSHLPSASISKRQDHHAVNDEEARIQRHNLTLLQFLQRLKKASNRSANDKDKPRASRSH